MPDVHIVNPNTSSATSAVMLEIARAAAPATMALSAITARHGPALIVDPTGLAIAAAAVAELASELTGQGVIIAAFGDPGADHLRRVLRVPVVGIGEAAIRAAGSGGRRFSIATTTPALETAIRSRVAALGHGQNLASIRTTTEDPAALTADPRRLEGALLRLVETCLTADGAAAVIIGGGPLARAARAISMSTGAVIIEPIPAAVAWISRELNLTA